jgi:Aldo/keto reductase family
MRYRTLGRTGIKVSAYALGAMMFGAAGDHDESIRIIRKALDAGINVIDTADIYSNGESEEIVGKALKDRRDSVVPATKARGRPRAGSPDTDIGETLSALSDLIHRGKVRAIGTPRLTRPATPLASEPGPSAGFTTSIVPSPGPAAPSPVTRLEGGSAEPHDMLGEVVSPVGSDIGSAPDRSWRVTRIMASVMITISARTPAETR